MAEAERRLAAILSADVAGYSRLMQADEEATVAALNDCRAVFKDKIDARQGRVVDTAGDSILAEFASVVEAVRAAVEIQETLVQHGASVAEDRRMRFRIGVDLGDVVGQDDGTIYGDGVNVAARIEALSDPGGIQHGANLFEYRPQNLSLLDADPGLAAQTSDILIGVPCLQLPGIDHIRPLAEQEPPREPVRVGLLGRLYQ